MYKTIADRLCLWPLSSRPLPTHTSEIKQHWMSRVLSHLPDISLSFSLLLALHYGDLWGVNG